MARYLLRVRSSAFAIRNEVLEDNVILLLYYYFCKVSTELGTTAYLFWLNNVKACEQKARKLVNLCVLYYI